MKNKQLYIFLYILNIFIIIFLIYTFYIYYNQNNKENFTPYIRKIYKPHVRKIRVFSEGLYNNTINKISTQIKKLYFF
jgi:hypothetical protein